MRAKFICISVTDYGGSEKINLQAVVSGSSENESFSKYTPSATLEMSIDNPDARDMGTLWAATNKKDWQKTLDGR